MDLELLQKYSLEKGTYRQKANNKILTASSVYRIAPNSDLWIDGIYEISFTLEFLDNILGDIDDIQKDSRLLNPEKFWESVDITCGSGVFLRAIVVGKSDLETLETDLLVNGEASLNRNPLYYFLNTNPLTIDSLITSEQSRWKEKIEEGIDAIMNHISR